MTKIHAKYAAMEMRKAGHSYNYIAPRVGVSKSTLSIWLAEIPYTPNIETIARIGRAQAAMMAAKSKIKRESFLQARKEAEQDIGTLSSRDLFMLGLGLYIGEGAKSSSVTCFVNSNVSTMRLIINWFTQAIGIKPVHIRIRLHLYPDSDLEKCHNYWSSQTGIPQEQFFRPVIDRRQDKRAIKNGKLPYGTAHLTVNSLGEKRFGVFLARKILAWSDIVLGTDEIAGLV